MLILFYTAPTPLPILDEPLDMSLKSRKRAASGDSITSNSTSNASETDSGTKKHRPTVILYGKLQERRQDSDNNIYCNMNGDLANCPPTYNVHHRRKIQPRLIITREYSADGIDEHFRKSLMKYMKKADTEKIKKADTENHKNVDTDEAAGNENIKNSTS